MKRSTYLYIAGLFFGGYLQNNLVPFLTNDILLVISIAWCIIGFICIRWNSLVRKTINTIQFTYILAILFFLSTLWPSFAYNQSFMSTLVAMRYNVLMIFYILLAIMSPSDEDIYCALRNLSMTTIAISVAIYFRPELFVKEQNTLNYFIDSTSDGTNSDFFAINPPGFQYLVFFFFIQINRTIKTGELRDFLFTTLLILFIVLVQNRSTIIVAVPCFIYSIFKSRIKYKNTILLLLAIIATPTILNIIDHLLNETVNQIDDDSYNRWQAFSFFLVEFKSSLWTVLFGHGTPCYGSQYLSDILYAQKTRLAFIADIGMFGTYFLYGLSMIIFYYYFVFKALLGKSSPLYLKMYAIWVLLVPTIHSFAGGYSCEAYFLNFLFFYEVVNHCKNRSDDRCIRNNSYI